MPKTKLALVVFTAFMVSGCMEDPAGINEGDPDNLDGPVQDVWTLVKERLTDVPCDVDTVGAETTANVVRLANTSYMGDDNETYGSNEIDIHGTLLAANSGGTVRLVNISNPLMPVFVGNTSERGSGDVKFTPDGLSVIAGGGGGIRIWDVRNPAQPVQVGQWVFPTAPPGGLPFQNTHMLYTAEINGHQWVFLAPNSNTGVWILKLEGTPDARSLTMVAQTLPVEGGPLGPHDMFVTHDADEGKWLLYSADGFHGWIVFDVSDPANPLPAGGFIHPATGYTHTIQAGNVGDRRIVVTSEEVGVNVLKVYDATVLAAPLLLGVWQHEAASRSPQHNFNIVEGKLYLAHYRHGIYVFDLAALGPAPVAGSLDLVPVAHYASGDPADDGLSVLGGFGSFWDVLLKDGILYGSHMGNGLHVIGYGCNAPGDPLLTSNG